MASHLTLDIRHLLMKRMASSLKHPDPPRKGAVVFPTPSALLCVCYCVELAPGSQTRLFTTLKRSDVLPHFPDMSRSRKTKAQVKQIPKCFYTLVKQFLSFKVKFINLPLKKSHPMCAWKKGRGGSDEAQSLFIML